MKGSIYIEKKDELKYVTFYTIRKEGQMHNEWAKFCDRFRKDKKYKEDYDTILAALETIGTIKGAGSPNRFRTEKSAFALPDSNTILNSDYIS